MAATNDPPLTAEPVVAARRYTTSGAAVGVMTALGVGWLVVAAVIVVWSARTSGGTIDGRGLVRAAVVAAIGVAHVVYAARKRNDGIEIAPHGFRSPAPDAEWLPWSAVRGLRVQRIRQRLVMQGDGGRAVAVLPFSLPRFTDAVDDVIRAAPHVVLARPLPASFAQSRPARVTRGAATLFIAVVPLGAALIVRSLIGGAAGLAVGGAAGLGWLALMAYRFRFRHGLEHRVTAVTIDPDGITTDTGRGTWRTARADLKAVYLMIERRGTTQGGDVFLLGTVASDQDHRTRSILPLGADPLVVLATARQLVTPPDGPA